MKNIFRISYVRTLKIMISVSKTTILYLIRQIAQIYFVHCAANIELLRILFVVSKDLTRGQIQFELSHGGRISNDCVTKCKLRNSILRSSY